MAEVIVLHDGFVTQKTLKRMPFLLTALKKILDHYHGQELCRLTSSEGIHERVYEFKPSGTLTLKLSTELPKNTINGVSMIIDGTKYSSAGHALLSGFDQKNQHYHCIKNDISRLFEKE